MPVKFSLLDQATGIPSFVGIKRSVANLVHEVADLKASVFNRIDQAVRDAATAASDPVTCRLQALQETVCSAITAQAASAIQSLTAIAMKGFQEPIPGPRASVSYNQAASSAAISDPSPASISRRQDSPYPSHVWPLQGTLQKVPANFSVDTTLPALAVWKLWLYGDSERRSTRPFRLLGYTDVPQSSRKRFSDLITFCSTIDFILERTGKFASDSHAPDEQNAAVMFHEEVWPVIRPPEFTPTGRARARSTVFTWTSHLAFWNSKNGKPAWFQDAQRARSQLRIRRETLSR